MNDIRKPAPAGDLEKTATESVTSPIIRSVASSRFPPGAVIGDRYRIEAYLDSGGMGQVYRAHDLSLDVALALKTIRPEIASQPAALRRFKQEVLLARSVTHPNACRIFDLGTDAKTGVSFLTMELLPGETLAARIRARGALPAEAALPLVRQMAEALDAAHRAGIVHRDFKSSNVMLVPGESGDRAVVTDFGLAMMVSHEQTPSRRPSDSGAVSDLAPESGAAFRPGPGPDRVPGTPAYMSPEQVAGRQLGPASDLYALGVVLFEMSTGQLPFRGTTREELERAHLTMTPPSPAALAPIDDAWERTILRLLSKEPENRFGTAGDAALALEGRISSAGAVRHSLAAERDAFVGRRAELEALKSCFEGSRGADPTRLVTLQGPGGSGKTRLAQRYGWESVARWPGGVWFCDLSEARSLDGVAQAVASSFGVQLGKEDPIVQLGHAIAGRGRCLVILDNLEQVVEASVVALHQWLDRCQESRFLVTSRERLLLPDEVIHPLDPLDPATYGAELFEVRAQAHRPGFRLEPSNREQVEEIVCRLDGLPLAIELAASRLRTLGLDQLRERLEHRFQILAGGTRGRHATLEATLDWSWDLLQPWEQSAIAQASVFDGGFSLEAAEAVIDLSMYEDAPFTLDVIQSLVDKSWLRTKVALGAPRFEMMGTVQEYAGTRLGESESEASGTTLPETERRHGLFYAELGSPESMEALDVHGEAKRHAALQLEVDNLVSACRRAVARGDERAARDTYIAAGEVLCLRGPCALLIPLGMDVLGATTDASLKPRTLLVLAQAENVSGKTENAVRHAKTALALCRKLGDRRTEADALLRLGNLHDAQGQMDEARHVFDLALEISRDLGNRRFEGILIANLGMLHQKLSQLENARELYEVAGAIHREVGNRRAEMVLINNLSVLSLAQGRTKEAREHCQAALTIAREMGNRRSEGTLLGNLGTIHYQERDLAEALACQEQALAVSREVGDRRAEGLDLGRLGSYEHELGRTDEALVHLEEALKIHREVGNRRSEGFTLDSLAQLLDDRGRTEEAQELYEKAIRIDREVGNLLSEALTLQSLATLHRGAGRVGKARQCLDESIIILRDTGESFELGVALCRLGKLAEEEQQPDQARAALAEAASIAEDLAVTPESELARSVQELRECLGDGDTMKESR